MRIQLPNPSNPPPKVAEILTSLRSRGDEDIAAGVNPRPNRGSGQYTKTYISMQISEYEDRISKLEAATQGPGGLSAEGGIGNLIKTYREMLENSKKALVTAPDRLGLFEILI
jgi:hypothetical protein